jgi:hypothetical protein
VTMTADLLERDMNGILHVVALSAKEATDER